MCNVINDQSKSGDGGKQSSANRASQSCSTGKNQTTHVTNSTSKITNFTNMNSTSGSAKHAPVKGMTVMSSAESKKF